MVSKGGSFLEACFGGINLELRVEKLALCVIIISFIFNLIVIPTY